MVNFQTKGTAKLHGCEIEQQKKLHKRQINWEVNKILNKNLHWDSMSKADLHFTSTSEKEKYNFVHFVARLSAVFCRLPYLYILKCRQKLARCLFHISWSVAACVEIAAEINTISFDGNNKICSRITERHTRYEQMKRVTKKKWREKSDRRKKVEVKNSRHRRNSKRSKQWQWRQPCKAYIITLLKLLVFVLNVFFAISCVFDAFCATDLADVGVCNQSGVCSLLIANSPLSFSLAFSFSFLPEFLQAIRDILIVG